MNVFPHTSLEPSLVAPHVISSRSIEATEKPSVDAELLLRGVIHSFGNLFQRILTKGELALDASSEDSMRSTLEFFIASSDVAILTVKNIQTLDRKSCFRREVELRWVLERATALLKIEAKKKSIELVISNAESVQANAEPYEIVQVTANLLLNAIQASPENSVIALCCQADGDEVVLSIKDKATGISPKLIPQVFLKPLQSSERGNCGIGLLASALIAKSHEGSIRLETSAKGTTASLHLPSLKGGR